MNYKYLPLAFFLLLVVAASLAGSSFEAGEWYYITMKRPAITPPAWLFAMASALVYVLMALAAWKVWLTGHYSRLGALTWWILLLILNTGWSVLFFGWHRPGWALPVAGVAVGIAIFCIRAFSPLSRPASYLMAPYLGWAVFVAIFNLAAWTANGGILARFVG